MISSSPGQVHTNELVLSWSESSGVSRAISFQSFPMIAEKSGCRVPSRIIAGGGGSTVANVGKEEDTGESRTSVSGGNREE